MIHMPTSIPPRKNHSPTREAENTPSSEMHRLIHEIANHLTVMNLCCFKVRQSATIHLPTALADLDGLEHAVSEISELLEPLTKLTGARTREAPNRMRVQPLPNHGQQRTNVYPLSHSSISTKKIGRLR
jgi:hypothetical protein